MSTTEPVLNLRPARSTDVRRIYRWRNLPAIVALSSSQRTVDWGEHRAWFANALKSPACRIQIIERNRIPIGQVRFERATAKAAVITVYLIPGQTGKGLGTQAIRQSCATIFQEWNVTSVQAVVRQENARALRAFTATGFRKPASSPKPTADLVILELKRPTAEGPTGKEGTCLDSGWKHDDRSNQQYFSRLLAQYGKDHRALDWGSQRSQHLRFAVLAGVGRLQGAKVLDVGCGLGDFYLFLQERQIQVDYTGIDITPAMITAARQRCPGARFAVMDLMRKPAPARPQFDFVFASGIFFLRQHQPAEYMKECVQRMFASCKQAVAWNSLSLWSPDLEVGEFHADPLQAIAMARAISPFVALRHDYHQRDFTVYLYRGQNVL